MVQVFEPYLCPYDLDDDELYFITYRPWIWTIDVSYKTHLDSLVNICNKNLHSLTDAGLRDKYLWLNKWTQKIINMFPTIKEEYEEEKRQRRALYKKELTASITRVTENTND